MPPPMGCAVTPRTAAEALPRPADPARDPRQTPRRSRPHLCAAAGTPPGNPRRHPRRRRLAQPRSTGIAGNRDA